MNLVIKVLKNSYSFFISALKRKSVGLNEHSLQMGVGRVLCAQSCPPLCDPMDCSLPNSSVHGVFRAEQRAGALPGRRLQPEVPAGPRPLPQLLPLRASRLKTFKESPGVSSSSSHRLSGIACLLPQRPPRSHEREEHAAAWGAQSVMQSI